jgi:hypothetical protein
LTITSKSIKNQVLHPTSPLKSTRCNVLPQTLRDPVQQSRPRDHLPKPKLPIYLLQTPRVRSINGSPTQTPYPNGRCAGFREKHPCEPASTISQWRSHRPRSNLLLLPLHLYPFHSVRKLSYSFQWVLASDILKQGRSVVIDSTCNYDETLNQGMALAKQCRVEYKYVECRVEEPAVWCVSSAA